MKMSDLEKFFTIDPNDAKKVFTLIAKGALLLLILLLAVLGLIIVFPKYMETYIIAVKLGVYGFSLFFVIILITTKFGRAVVVVLSFAAVLLLVRILLQAL